MEEETRHLQAKDAFLSVFVVDGADGCPDTVLVSPDCAQISRMINGGVLRDVDAEREKWKDGV